MAPMSDDSTLLKIEYIALGDAVLWERNPKRHDIGALVELLGKVSPMAMS